MAISPMYLTTAFLQDRMNGNVDMDGDSFYAALFSGSLRPSSGHGTWGDWSASEISDAGDYGGPVDVATPTIITDGHLVSWDTADVSFGTGVSITAKYMGLFIGDEASPLSADRMVGWVDLNMQAANITRITRQSPAQVTASGHGFATDRYILIMNSDMREANRRIVQVTAIDVNTFSLQSTDLTEALEEARTGLAIDLDDTTEGEAQSGNFQVRAPSGGWFVEGG